MKKHFLIENKNDTESKVILFGLNRYLLTPNYGSNIGVDIWVIKYFEPQPAADGDYFEALQYSSENPFRIKTIQFDCKDESYVKEVALNYFTKDANGVPYEKDYNFKTCEKQKTDLPIDANSEISFHLKPKQIIHLLINE